MKKLIILGLLAGFLVFAPMAGFAEESKDTSPDRVQMIEDDEAGVIRFIIDGQERATLDSEGLHVHGDIEFTGTTKDIHNWPDREAENAP